ncbi:Serine/threonine-protein phosphatase 6 regulatory ankyrin repeat subunit B [Lachnellula subtilissima]|uniref:Serine/threonine-protein phosphatase 6 regulatory ankyrin repeat subunit B n=1 Tax=Lachnellula subtilissima TaxID=602034 RepID=A0A8H8U7I5_9HELO|nr:Serine/threonine-protein phosphatase 6 regulatory ankyrin repeat subunit B [Lachnellula subtilissima]
MADPLSIAASIAGLVTIADTIFTQITTLSGLLHNLALVLGEYEEDTPDANLRLHHINSCRETLLKIRDKIDWKTPLDPSSSRSTLEAALRRLKWPFSGSEMKSLLSEVEMHKSTINAALAGDNLSMTLRALSRQDKMSEDIKDLKTDLETRWAVDTHITLTRQRQEILQFFEKLDPMTYHRTNLNLHHPLTGLWLTEGNTFKTWLHSRNSKLWLSGIPGAGKTVLAACVIEEVMKESSSTRAVAYFYCDYKSVETQKPTNILSSLATQLARQNETAFTPLQKLYEKHHPKDRGTILLQVSDLVKTVSQQSSCFEDVSVVVDGLDECGNDTADIVQSLASLATNSSSNIRALFLSRDEYEIRELLQQQFSVVSIAAHKEDLELYVAAEIASRQRKLGREQLRIRSPELRDHIIQTLVNGADGMFRWAACQLDLLAGLPTDAAKRQALTSLPPTLFKTYERILERISESHFNVQEMVQNTLKWILHSHDIVSAAQICEAVSIKESDTILNKESLYEQEHILLYCSSLIRLSSSGKCFELAHFTVKEFLESLSESSGPLFAPYSQDKDHVYPYLAKTCLAYIKLDVFCGDVIEDHDTWKDQQRQHPFRTHAVCCWYNYAENAWNDESIRAHARELFCLSRTSSFLSWARDYIHLIVKYVPVDLEEVVHFIQMTELICLGRVSPLHMASAIGCVELCKLLLDLNCSINQVSSMGTPVHCALIGALEYSIPVEFDKWLHFGRGFLGGRRAKVLDLLIKRGADISVPYRADNGKEYSCSKLAVDACMGRGVNHPLVKLVEAGGKLHDSAVSALKEEQDNEDGHMKEAVEALVASLNENAQEDRVRSELLTLALQLRSSAAIELVKKKTQAYCHLDLEDLKEAFFRAIQYDQKEVIEELLTDHRLSPIAGFRTYNRTALHLAAETDSTNAIVLLLNLGAEVDARDELGLTPLHYAAAQKSSDEHTISLLIDNGASTTVGDQNGRTVWHIAAENDNAIGLKTLIRVADSRQESHLLPDKNGVIPLFTAAITFHRDAFEILLNQMKDVQYLLNKCPKDLRLVHYAVSMNSKKLLEMLDDKEGEIHQKTDDGRTALHFVPEHVDPAIVQKLIDVGLSPDMVDYDGRTPLHSLIQNEVEIDENVFAMLATDSTIAMSTKTGLTALHFAVSVGPKEHVNYKYRERVFQKLLAKGINVHVRDSNHISCLQMLFSFKTQRPEADEVESSPDFEDFVYSVATSITDIDILNETVTWDACSYRLIGWAILQRNESLTELLLSKGVDTNLKNLYTTDSGLDVNWTPSQMACFRGFTPKLMRGLLEHSQGLHDNTDEGYSLAHLACMKGLQSSCELLEVLSEYGIDFNLRSSKGLQTPLHLAARSGMHDHVRFLLQHGVDSQAKDSYGWQAIHEAVAGEYHGIFKQLMDLDFDWNGSTIDCYISISKTSHTRCNVLHHSAIGNNKDIIQTIIDAAAFGVAGKIEALLSAGADIEAEDPSGCRALHMASRWGKFENAQILLAHGCSLVCDTKGMSPELYALKHGHNNIVDLLRNHERGKVKLDNPSISQHQKKSSTMATQSLSIAIDLDDLLLCKRSVESGADLNKPHASCKCCKPVIIALRDRKFEIASYLVKKGASTTGQVCDTSTYRGFSALHLASGEESEIQLLVFLLKNDLEAGSPSFQSPVTPVHVAAACNNIPGLKILLQHAQINDLTFVYDLIIDHLALEWTWYLSNTTSISSTEGLVNTTAMHIAVKERSIDCIKLLLEYGATVDCLNRFRETPLHSAADLGYLEIVQLLVENGANPNARSMGRIPAMFAAKIGHTKVSKYLVERGTSLTQRDMSGETLFHQAGLSNAHTFSYLLQIGCSPEVENYEGLTAVEIALEYAENNMAKVSLIMNWDLDYECCIRKVPFTWEQDLWPVLKLLFKRLGFARASQMINTPFSETYIRETLLTKASKSGDTRGLDVLIQAGANLELEGCPEGSALNAACHEGRLASVIYLIRAGANIFGIKDGLEFTAVQSAQDFPAIVEWLLVKQHTQQPKLCWETGQTVDGEMASWQGPMLAEVPISGLYSPKSGASSIDRAKELSQLRKELEGKVVHFDACVEKGIFNIKAYLKKYGEDGKVELNKVASLHTNMIAEDEKTVYSGCAIVEGSMRILFGKTQYGTNISQATEPGVLGKAINAAGIAAGTLASALDFDARTSTKNEYDPGASGVPNRLKTIFGLPSLTLVPNFEANYAILQAVPAAAVRDLPRDWQKRMGAHALQYFEGLAKTSEGLGFATDNMM